MEYFLQIQHGPAVNRSGVHFRGVFTRPDPSRLVATSATSQTSPGSTSADGFAIKAYFLLPFLGTIVSPVTRPPHIYLGRHEKATVYRAK